MSARYHFQPTRTLSAINGFMKHKRRELGMTQVQFAAIVGASDTLVSHWEANRREPTRRNVQRLCAHLGLNSKMYEGFLTQKRTLETEDVAMIKGLCEVEGSYDTRIAELFNTTSGTISAIRLGKTHKYIKPETPHKVDAEYVIRYRRKGVLL